ncbi:MAG: hypothetical protein EOM15_00570 [Spirochaetia bacterium]|nr:hypothetical protein [Spirochaetia bacterium]
MPNRNLFHPERFQGTGRKRSYFEGWYFKIAALSDQQETLALIPGISHSDDGLERHAFIQVISSKEQKSWYIRFPYDVFRASDSAFSISIDHNTFSTEHLSVHLKTDDLVLDAECTFKDIHPFPVSLRAPGIMGWYAYVPRMECFHGVVSTTHTVEGLLNLNGRHIVLHEAKGYIEKDWGTSFPKAWIWMQANCFQTKNLSTMLSIAKIPFARQTFLGFLGFVQLPDRLLRFATYTKASILSLQSTDDDASVIVQTKEHQLHFDAALGSASKLTAPRNGVMDRTIKESVAGTLQLTIYNRDNTMLLQETSTLAGIELSEASSLMD